jgi:hypothetical protein
MKPVKTTCRQKMGRVAGLLYVAALLAACGPEATAQAAGAADPGPLASHFTVAGASARRQFAELVVCEIDDPHSGARWLLLRDRNHPAGPGRLVLIATANRQAGQGEPGGTISPMATELIPLRPVIRAGDRLVVEENTAVVEARLEAVALGPATLGSTFDVRLKMGGKVARVVALAPGRAAFQARTEARP